MSIFRYFHNYITQCIIKIAEAQSIKLEENILKRITVEPPKEETHGHIATNASMILSKIFKTSPKNLAQFIKNHLEENPDVQNVEIAGPGFINITLKNEYLFNELLTIIQTPNTYGLNNMGKGQKILVEFVSANPTGPIHAGHGRNAILGDVIASLLEKSGFQVTREYYINDAGGQIEALAKSVFLRYKQALGYSITNSDFDGDLYPGSYLINIGKTLAEKHGNSLFNEEKSMNFISEYAISSMMKLIRNDLELLGVFMDEFRSEKSLNENKIIEKTLALLQNSGDIYQGILEKPKGHQDDEWEEREQTLFKATKYGDDADRAIKKSDGSWTYFAGDIAYHYDKWQRGFNNMINIFGADHSGYVKRLTSAVSAITRSEANFEIKVSQMVNFIDHGTPVRMSKRDGTFITVSDVINRVGKDATRFLMISRHSDMPLDFDFEKIIEQSKDNPIFYIQYAHARICSVKRYAEEVFEGITQNFYQANIEYIRHQNEWLVIKKMADWPRQIELATITYEPHRIANYLYSLASIFHILWNQGKEDNELRFIHSKNKEQTIAKLALLEGVSAIIGDGLKLLGIEPLKEMRA